jgi:DNA-binding response OmpR family regulator
MLDYLEQGLTAAGHETRAANSIESVIDKFSEERFDIFVSDIFQPVLESIALFTTIARTSPKTRIIALMDFKTERARQYDLSLWVDSVIAKPFTVGRVASEVEFLLAVAARRASSPELV